MKLWSDLYKLTPVQNKWRGFKAICTWHVFCVFLRAYVWFRDVTPFSDAPGMVCVRVEPVSILTHHTNFQDSGKSGDVSTRRHCVALVPRLVPPLADAGPMQHLCAGPSEQWFYDVILFSQPDTTFWWRFFNKMAYINIKKDGNLLGLICMCMISQKCPFIWRGIAHVSPSYVHVYD